MADRGRTRPVRLITSSGLLHEFLTARVSHKSLTRCSFLNRDLDPRLKVRGMGNVYKRCHKLNTKQ